MAVVDWNAAVLILDTLSEDNYSFTELDDYICRYYGRDVVHESLSLLVRRDFVCVLERAPNEDAYEEVNAEERSRRVERFFEIASQERNSSIANWLGLTPGGKDLLRLIGIGHPPR